MSKFVVRKKADPKFIARNCTFRLPRNFASDCGARSVRAPYKRCDPSRKISAGKWVNTHRSRGPMDLSRRIVNFGKYWSVHKARSRFRTSNCTAAWQQVRALTLARSPAASTEGALYVRVLGLFFALSRTSRPPRPRLGDMLRLRPLGPLAPPA